MLLAFCKSLLVFIITMITGTIVTVFSQFYPVKPTKVNWLNSKNGKLNEKKEFEWLNCSMNILSTANKIMAIPFQVTFKIFMIIPLTYFDDVHKVEEQKNMMKQVVIYCVSSSFVWMRHLLKIYPKSYFLQEAV